MKQEGWGPESVSDSDRAILSRDSAMDTHTAARVRERLEHWLETTGMAQRQFALRLQKSQIWLQKVLSGENHVRLKDLDALAIAMRTTPSELVRLPEDRYQLEATPTELRLIERLRDKPELAQAVATLLGIGLAPSTPEPAQVRKDGTRGPGRPLKSRASL